MPLLLRAPLSAIAVTGTATVVWEVLVQSNLQFSPKLPWAAVVMAAFLIFYWKFLSGWGWPSYGAAAAIAGASVVFGLAHLGHGAFLPAILFDIGWGAIYGLLTHLSGSILPAIMLHSSADAIEFLAAWKFPVTAPTPLLWESGADKVFWFDCGMALLLGIAAALAFRQLARHRTPSAS
jgi:hypothetical protein